MSSIYFIGMGGTAMASVAVALSRSGHAVSGSDTALYPPMSDYLAQHRIACHTDFDPENLIEDRPDTVVVGNAVSRGNPELEFALNEHLRLVSMPEIVRRHFIEGNKSVVIAGTHGKTTTTSLTAWLFECGSLKPGFLIGGIAENFQAGCRASGKNGTGFFVTEGDEYDTAFFDKRSKFLHYRPDIAVINNMEFDHADIFDSIEDIRKSFRQFVNLIPSRGVLLLNGHDENACLAGRQAFCPVERFGFSPEYEWAATEVSHAPEGVSFTLRHRGNDAGRLRIEQFGNHNVLNSLAAIAAACHGGVAIETIREGLLTFKRPRRRMETVGEFPGGITLIDDFAHHPTAIVATLESLRQRWPRRRIIACFEPRSNTSTRAVFQHDLESSFRDADIVVLGRVHRPERYDESERLDTGALAEAIERSGKTVFRGGSSKTDDYPRDIARFLCSTMRPGDLVVLLSNGSFNGLKTLLTESFRGKS